MDQKIITRSEFTRPELVRRGRYLEYFTVVYNSLEGLIAVLAGMTAGSIALVGFGFDSLIEVTSGVTLLWRLHADVDEARREKVELISLRIVGVCFIVLGLYVTYDSIKSLIRREAPEESTVGIILAVISLSSCHFSFAQNEMSLAQSIVER
jgi:divalent metal cation (Fe/Co/Zn/Cd) transporter